MKQYYISKEDIARYWGTYEAYAEEQRRVGVYELDKLPIEHPFWRKGKRSRFAFLNRIANVLQRPAKRSGKIATEALG